MTANVNFPGGASIVTLRSEPRIVQKLAGDLSRTIVVGSRVERGQSLAEGASGAARLTIALADRLGCAAHEVEKLLTKPVGSRFDPGEEIAKARKVLGGHSVVEAPFAGTLLSYNAQSGVGIFAASDLGDHGAPVGGIVASFNADVIAIQVSGSRVFGIIGFGQRGSGSIRLISKDPSHVPAPSEIVDAHRGCVIIAGAWVPAGVYKRLREIKAAAVISGGLFESEAWAAFSPDQDEGLAIWRDAAQRIPSPMAIVATEGFGRLQMHPALWSFFQEYEGREAVVMPETSLDGPLVRPQIVIEDRVDEGSPSAALGPGAQLRLIDQSNLGRAVEAVSGPIKASDGRGRAIDAIQVRGPDGRVQVVPVASVELVA